MLVLGAATAVSTVLGVGMHADAQQPAGTFRQRCPPCEAVTAAQRADGLPVDALRDHRWAIGPHGVNAEEWMRKQTGRALGKGATILQIDTGVTAHPTFRIPQQGSLDSGVGITDADGLYGDGHRNVDLLLPGFLRFPGHGTKTASVIMAEPWRIAPAEMESRTPGDWCVDEGGTRFRCYTRFVGVAPGARLVPVRGTQGVLLLPTRLGELETEQWRIAVALNAAAAGESDPVLRRRIDVVTMSLGGWPPTDELCAAVKNATDRGVIVLAAAGNEVRRAVFPARCATTIAVAGSTHGQAPWSGSAGWEGVAVAAPAEAVWTSSVVNGRFCVEASSGTSFAVALTAGIAAEWVAWHRQRGIAIDNPPAAFRAALTDTARRWTGGDAGSWSRRFGVGIVDLTRLMEKAERDASSRGAPVTPRPPAPSR